MPPQLKEQSVVLETEHKTHDDDDHHHHHHHVHDDDVTKKSAPKLKAAFEERYFAPAPELLTSLAIAGTVGYALYTFGVFTNYYWFAIMALGLTLEATSPSTHHSIQFVFPFILAAQCMYYDNAYPTTMQYIMYLPTSLLLTGVGMSVCLHRYFSHSAFETSRAFQFVLGLISAFAYQAGPLWWAGKHGRHHHHCDQPEDPHSWHVSGFCYALVGWTTNPISMSQRDVKYINPKILTPEIKFLDRFYVIPVCLTFALLDANYGRAFCAYNLLLPMLTCRFFTLLFNVVYHPAASRRRCKSLNVSIMIADLVGEGEHNIHHKKPALAKRNYYDVPYWITIFWMEKVGLVWNVR